MSSIYESTNYNLSYRGILTNNEFKLYTTNNSINVSSEISFDINADYASSINYFAASILGGIAHGIVSQSKQLNIDIEELEGKIHLNLKNPLSLIGVKGYNEEPKIDFCNITYYLYADYDENDLLKFCNTALNKSFIYNTLKHVINFDIKFILIE